MEHLTYLLSIRNHPVSHQVLYTKRWEVLTIQALTWLQRTAQGSNQGFTKLNILITSKVRGYNRFDRNGLRYDKWKASVLRLININNKNSIKESRHDLDTCVLQFQVWKERNQSAHVHWQSFFCCWETTHLKLYRNNYLKCQHRSNYMKNTLEEQLWINSDVFLRSRRKVWEKKKTWKIIQNAWSPVSLGSYDKTEYRWHKQRKCLIIIPL